MQNCIACHCARLKARALNPQANSDSLWHVDFRGDVVGDSIERSDSIDGSGFPLGFKVRDGVARPGVIGLSASSDTYRVELRAMGGHQKEAVVSEGDSGAAYRAVSDEGPGLNGTDLAPNPLSFFTAALPADILSRFLQLAKVRGLAIASAASTQVNIYSFQGSFMRGDGRGYAEAPRITLKLAGNVSATQVREVADAALRASPLAAMCGAPLDNTFALYANGRRRTFAAPTPSRAPDATDPLKVWKSVPVPLDVSLDVPGMIARLGDVAPIASSVAPAVVAAPMEPMRREIRVAGSTQAANGLSTSEILSGTARWGIRSDERSAGDQAPSALAVGAWGIAFCLTTQFLRYADFHKMKIRALRVVQSSPFEIQGSVAAGDLHAIAHPVDTHIFLHGEESDERMEKLMVMAQNTCYLHALLAGALAPVVDIELNGSALGH